MFNSVSILSWVLSSVMQVAAFHLHEFCFCFFLLSLFFVLFLFFSKQQRKKSRNKRNTVLICGMFCLLQVHLKSQFILNGVCVIWRGWIDLVRLDGIGSLDFDGERAEVSSKTLPPPPQASHPLTPPLKDVSICGKWELLSFLLWSVPFTLQQENFQWNKSKQKNNKPSQSEAD